MKTENCGALPLADEVGPAALIVSYWILNTAFKLYKCIAIKIIHQHNLKSHRDNPSTSDQQYGKLSSLSLIKYTRVRATVNPWEHCPPRHCNTSLSSTVPHFHLPWGSPGCVSDHVQLGLTCPWGKRGTSQGEVQGAELCSHSTKHIAFSGCKNTQAFQGKLLPERGRENSKEF